MKISVVINTFNEEANLKKALKSVNWADELIVCDMHSTDKTVEIAKTGGAKVYQHEQTGFVEPARNFAISKATGDWILILDADEEVSEQLQDKLKELAESSDYDFMRIPRKNIIFNKWMSGAMWWPDYNIRFFKKGKVVWSDKIHISPQASGRGLDLPAQEQFALIHSHYASVSQFIERMNRYTTVQAEEIIQEGYKFSWTDLIKKPMGEFLGRYFANEGYKEGIHGLALSLLQALSFLVVYLKIWEKEKFVSKEITINEIKTIITDSAKEFDYWTDFVTLSKHPVKKIFQKITRKLK